MRAYEVPEWGRDMPSFSDHDPFYLEVLKEGVILEQIPLSKHKNISKSYLILGRQADAVDITLENPSVSRQHAVIQFKGSDSSVHIFDLGSAQGTFVNKTKLAPLTYHKLNVGDIIKFAASMRMFVLMGPDECRPPEYDSANLQRFREKAQSRSADTARRKEREDSVSWGMEGDEDDPTSSEARGEVEDESVHDDSEEGSLTRLKRFVERSREEGRNKRAVEKLQEREAKIRRLEEDSRRISAKELSQEGGLTAGQAQALERNSAAVAKVREEIDAILAEQRLDSGGGSETKKFKKDNFKDDDFMFDTTGETADVASNWRMRRRGKGSIAALGTTPGSALSYEDLLQQKSACEEALARIMSRRDSLAATTEGNSDVSGDVDDVLLQLKRQDVATSLRALAAEEAEQRDKLRLVEKYARLAAPALPSLIKPTQTLTATASIAPEVPTMVNDASEPSVVDTSPPVNVEVVSEPPVPVGEVNVCSAPPCEDENLFIAEKLDEQEDALQGEETTVEAVEPIVTKGPALRVSPSAEPHDAIPATKKPKLNVAKQDDTVSLGPSSTLQGGERVWVPPSGQTGSGRTKLNDKYGY